MSQPSLNDFQLEPSTSREGSWRDWPPAAQKAISCGGAAAIAVILLSLVIWILFAASVKFMASTVAGPGKPAAKTAPKAQTPAPGNPRPPVDDAR